MNNILILIISIAIPQVVGFIGSIVTIPAISSWYKTLNKPVFNPPNAVFGPVWTILFLLMGISLYLIWIKDLKSKKVKEGMNVFMIQLGLNLLWSIIFFGFHYLFLAFVDIVVLWGLILITILKFSKISKPAAYLLIPYLLWVSFAAILNFSILIIN